MLQKKQANTEKENLLFKVGRLFSFYKSGCARKQMELLEGLGVKIVLQFLLTSIGSGTQGFLKKKKKIKE